MELQNPTGEKNKNFTNKKMSFNQKDNDIISKKIGLKESNQNYGYNKENNNKNNNNVEENKLINNINLNKDKNENYSLSSFNNFELNEKNDSLLKYKKELFMKLKKSTNTYKREKSKGNYFDFEQSSDNKYYNNKDTKTFKKQNKQNDLNKDLKLKYIKKFFSNMKKYTKSNDSSSRNNKSPEFGTKTKKKEQIIQKPKNINVRIKHYYSGQKTLNNKYVIEKNVNEIMIPACYNNPQRDSFLRIINEKKKQNPNNEIEFLFPQFPIMPFYPNMYPGYNPYPLMAPPQQCPPQITNLISAPVGGINYDVNEKNLNFSDNMNIKDDNINYQINEQSPNQNLFSSTNKSYINFSNSGNINTTSSFK